MTETAAPEVTVRGIASSGDGVASLPDGRTVFVPRAAPGDRVQLRNIRGQKRFARAAIAEIVAHSPDRVTPPCPHYVTDRCGSCQLMHLTADAQRAAKARIAGDALRRLAKLDRPDPPITAADQQLGYRTKITFALRHGRLGYHPLDDPAHVFTVRNCLLAHPDLQTLHQALRRAPLSLLDGADRVVLRRDRDGGLHLVVRTLEGVTWRHGAALHRALTDRGGVVTVWWHPDGGAPRAVAGSSDPWPASVFEQVNPAMGALVRERAIERLGDVHGRHVWDLYAGIGETTRALAARGATVQSVEWDGRAVAFAERLGPDGPQRLAGRVEDRLADLRTPDAVITNPPRTGMGPSVSDGLAAAGPARIAYISCDPATLSRDLARLAPHYDVTQVDAFDQFPQTAHLECVALLERR